MAEGIVAEEIQSESATASTTCVICGKELEGIAVANDRRMEVYKSLIGFACENCGARYCESKHDKQLKAGFLGANIHKSTCVKCGQNIGFGDLIVNPETLPEGFNAQARPAGAQQQNVQKPNGVYFAARKVPESCPACGGSNISAIERPTMSVVVRVVNIVIGVLAILGLWWMNTSGYFEGKNEILSLVIQFALLVLGAGFFWEGLTLRPLPILGRYIIAPSMKTYATCPHCGRAWVVS